jgi:hypothetical protein
LNDGRAPLLTNIQGERAGSLTLCALKDGGHTIGYIFTKNPDGAFQVESDREGEVVGVCGRVVSVQQIDDADGILSN